MEADGRLLLTCKPILQVYDSLIPDEERHYSGLVAAHLNIPIHYHVADDYQLYERWDQPELHRPMPHHYPLDGELGRSPEKVVRRSRVVLTGEGGDIIFCPSGSYFDDLLKSRQWGRLAHRNRTEPSSIGVCRPWA